MRRSRCPAARHRSIDRKVAPPHARRDEAFDGSADPSLQALYRGLPRAAGRDLYAPSKRRRASSASISSPTAPTGPIAARSARRDSPISQAMDFLARATCWRIRWRSSAPWTSFSARSIDERSIERASTSRRASPSPRRWPSEEAHRQIPGGPPGERGDAAARARAAPDRRLAAARGDGSRRRRCSIWRRSASTRSRPSTRCST